MLISIHICKVILSIHRNANKTTESLAVWELCSHLAGVLKNTDPTALRRGTGSGM